MHYIDIIMVVIFLVAMIYGFYKGFIASFLTLIGLVATVVLVARLTPQVKAGIMLHYEMSELIASLLTYLLIIVMVAVLVSLIRILLHYLAQLMMLTMLNRIIGAAFTFLSCLCAVILLLIVMDFIPVCSGIKQYLVENSKIISGCQNRQKSVMYQLPDKVIEALNKINH